MKPYEPDAATSRSAEVFAAAAASMVTDEDVIDTLARLTLGCADALSADGGGLVVKNPGNGQLELLASTSHAAHDLELYQLQSDTGPCVDAVRTEQSVTEGSRAAMIARWPELSEPIERAAYSAVLTAPLRWQGDVLGALNLFWHAEGDVAEQAALLQGFADVATIAIVHADHVSHARVVERMRTALSGRTVVEQAKGVLAYRRRVDMQRAFTALLEIADQRGTSLSSTAAAVVAEAATGRRAERRTP